MSLWNRIKGILYPLAGGLLVGYVLLLIALSHYEQAARIDADARRVRLGLEKRAAALSYFYSVRMDELETLAEHRTVETFFANRDLGMSMQYGLQDSLLKLARAFEGFVKHRQVGNKPVYQRLILREQDGGILVDTHPSQTRSSIASDQANVTSSKVIAEGRPIESVLVTSPVWHKGRLIGHVFGWIDHNLAQRLFIATDDDQPDGAVFLELENVLPKGGEAAPQQEAAISPAGDDIEYLADGTIVVRAGVENTPFLLVGQFPPAGFGAVVSPRWLSFSLIVLAAFVLLGLRAAAKVRTDNFVLHARVDESARQREILRKKNNELEVEIGRREQYETELLLAREAAEAASRAKSEFLATMSHEIRTPINGVLGTTELLLHSDLHGRQRQLTDAAHRSARTLLTLIDDILDFSRIEAGRFTLNIQPFDLDEIVTDVVQAISATAEAKHLELLTQCDNTVPKKLLGDGQRLRQILLNIGANAVKFTDRGRVQIDITSERGEADHVWLHCTVRDSGIGIRDEDRAAIFDSFTQVESSTTRRFGGSGLGLAITRKLVEMMGGSIDVDSVFGAGSVFTVKVYLKTIDTQISNHGEQSRLPRVADKECTARILIVEDNAVNQEVVSGMLDMLGCDSVVVDNGAKAVAKASEQRFDLVLMDCHMPEMDGFEAAKRIRENGMDPRRLPILAFTADVRRETRERCEAAGVNGYLSKPFTLQQLVDALRKWLPVAAETLPAKSDVTIRSPSSLLDRKALELLRRSDRPGKPSLLDRVIRTYLEHSPKFIEGIRQASTLKDAESLAFNAHSLKSSSANVGATGLAALCLKLEKRGRDGDVENLEALVEETIGAFEAVADELRHMNTTAGNGSGSTTPKENQDGLLQHRTATASQDGAD